MSCDLLYQDDWLEYPSSMSFLNLSVLIIVAIVGIILFSSELWIESKLKTCTNLQISSSLSTMLRLLQITSIVMVVVSLLLIIISVMNRGTTNNGLNLILIGSILVAILAVFLIALCAGISIEMAKLNNCPNFPSWIWIPLAILAAAGIGLAIYRYRTRTNVSIPKRNVDWSNLENNINTIEQIGKMQGRQCGKPLTAEESLFALGSYLDKKKRNKSVFSYFRSKQLAPGDKLPNLVKMYEMAERVEAAKQIITEAKEKGASPQELREIRQELSNETGEQFKQGWGEYLSSFLPSWR